MDMIELKKNQDLCVIGCIQDSTENVVDWIILFFDISQNRT